MRVLTNTLSWTSNVLLNVPFRNIMWGIKDLNYSVFQLPFFVPFNKKEQNDDLNNPPR